MRQILSSPVEGFFRLLIVSLYVIGERGLVAWVRMGEDGGEVSFGGC